MSANNSPTPPRTHPVAVHMTSVNGTVHKLENGELTDNRSRPQSRNDRPRENEGRRSRSRSRSRGNSPRSRSSPRRNQNNEPRANQRDDTPLLNDAELIPISPAKHPELDDEDDIDVPYNPNGPRTGVDDGFFTTTTTNTTTGTDVRPIHEEPDPRDKRIDIPEMTPGKANGNGDIPPSRRPSMNFPYAPGFPGTGVQVFSDGDEAPRIIPDVNVYQQKKNLAQGMMDLALISANANQLRYVLEAGTIRHPYYYFSVIFISFSLFLQVAVGIGLILNSRYNVKNQDDICKADKINNMTIIGIFLITIVNVFIASFGVADVSTVNRG